jgi:excisionase family DNA binding protein
MKMNPHHDRIAISQSTEPMRPITVRIREACRITGIGRSKIYELIRDGDIETVKVGSLTLVTVAGLESFIARQHRPKV